MKNKQKIFVYIIALAVTLVCLGALEMRHQKDEATIHTLRQENAELTELQTVSDELIQIQAELLDELILPPEELPADKSDRGTNRGECRIMEVTAYDLSVESCGKPPGHPEYGITASGKRVREWHTIAAGKGIPFGTQVYIPYFKDKPNGGIFTVEDRGGAIKDGRLDVYMESNSECMEFGRQELEVYILE